MISARSATVNTATSTVGTVPPASQNGTAPIPPTLPSPGSSRNGMRPAPCVQVRQRPTGAQSAPINMEVAA